MEIAGNIYNINTKRDTSTKGEHYHYVKKYDGLSGRGKHDAGEAASEIY